MALYRDFRPLCTGWYLSDRALQEAWDIGPESRYYDSVLAEHVATSPLRRFTNLNRGGMEDAHCFVGLPPFRHDNNGEQIPLIPDRLFHIFFTNENYGNLIFDWEWRKGNTQTGYPENWETDFGTEV